MFSFETTQLNKTDYLFKAGTVENKLSEILEDLPNNCYVNKSITGCGATTIAIINNVNYLILVPFTNLLISKCSQHKELQPVYSGISDDELSEYLQGKRDTYKVIATYEALPRILKNPFFDISKFKLMVDEAHLLVNQASFRTGSCQYILKNYNKFEKYVFVTATPTKRKFFPTEIENLPLLNIIWEDTVEANFKTYYLDSKNTMVRKLVAICMGALLEDSERELHIFYNSVSELVQVLLRLKAADEFEFNKEDFRLVCSSNQKSRVQDVLGKTFGKISTLADPVRKLNFYTSTAFEGGDVISNLPSSCEQYICINGSRDHTKLDFTSTVSQIVGRIRNKADNNIHFLISNAPESIQFTEEEWENEVTKRIESVNRLLNDYKYNTTISEELRASGEATARSSYYTVWDEDINEIVVPDVALKNELQSYQALHATYYVQATEIDKSKASSLQSILDNTDGYNNFDIPYEEVLLQIAGYKHFQKAMKFYCEFKEKSTHTRLIELLEASCPQFKEYYETLGSVKIKSSGYSESKIIQAIKKAEDDVLSEDLIPELKLNIFYSNSELKEQIQSFYDRNDLSLTAKASDVKKWYSVKSTKISGVNGLILRGRL